VNITTKSFLIAFAALGITGAALAQDLPAGKNKDLVQRACTSCHELDISDSQRMTRDQWWDVVQEMVGRGANLSDEEIEQVSDYLAANFGPLKKDSPEGTKASETADASKPGSVSKVSINDAGADQLVRELGLAEADAKAIVAFRSEHGPYKDLSGLKKVPDLDLKKIDALKDRLSF
jgi:competence ComEA-like helix-hairpin-helix protein